MYVPPHHQPINPEDEDDVIPDQHGIATSSSLSPFSSFLLPSLDMGNGGLTGRLSISRFRDRTGTAEEAGASLERLGAAGAYGGWEAAAAVGERWRRERGPACG